MDPRPVRLEPRWVERVWGGRRLTEVFGRELPEGVPVGESWEVFGALTVAEGPYRGLTLDQLGEQEGEAFLGTATPPGEGFPLLIKWLDCRDWLSVQVHPDDALARQLTGDPLARGKSECWVVVDCEPGSELIWGLREGVTVEELEGAEGAGLVPLLKRLEPRPGQVIMTPSGTLHALGPGMLLLEVQQSSDLTYRLHDWDRPGLDGLPRPLHRPEALMAARIAPPSWQGPVQGGVGRLEVVGPHFLLERLEESCRWTPSSRSFEILVQLRGRARLQVGESSQELRSGQAVVLPACALGVDLDVQAGGSVARVRLP